jgi:hypothetical protein
VNIHVGRNILEALACKHALNGQAAHLLKGRVGQASGVAAFGHRNHDSHYHTTRPKLRNGQYRQPQRDSEFLTRTAAECRKYNEYLARMRDSEK